MSGITIHSLGIGYLSAALAVAAAFSVFAGGHSPAAGRQGIVILLAAALWPVMIVGVAQLGVLVIISCWVRRRAWFLR